MGSTSVLEALQIKDFYSTKGKPKNRFIDIALVDADGHIDVVEIKKPFENAVLSKGKYRDNYTPRKELSGSIMQVEKYLFHLNKWGFRGEEEINRKRSKDLPQGLKIRIVNPKGLIMLGRDDGFTDHEKFDFEVVRRKYANVMDIITYDDLLRRLDNMIDQMKRIVK
jgi:hypothetical protein